jgi:hypothetical protein
VGQSVRLGVMSDSVYNHVIGIRGVKLLSREIVIIVVYLCKALQYNRERSYITFRG